MEPSGLLPLEPTDDSLDGFSSKQLALHVQRKQLGRPPSGPPSDPQPLSEAGATALDELYRVARDHSGSKKAARRLVKDIVKLVLAVAPLWPSQRLPEPDASADPGAHRLRAHVHRAAMTALSFYQVEFTFDEDTLSSQLCACAGSLRDLLEAGRPLVARVERARRALAALLPALYLPGGRHRPSLARLSGAIDSMLDSGTL